MLRMTVWLCVGVFLWGFASCSIRCPDGSSCSDMETCCQTAGGYNCCPYPKAVCCSDLAHCCPSGYLCDLATQMCVKQYQPWITIPIVRKVAAEVSSTPDLSLTPFEEVKQNNSPEQLKSSGVYCDSYTACPDGTTCCKHPKSGWFCCPLSPAKCCLDGFHCCPYGYDCDHTYTQCVRERLEDLFTYKKSLTSVPASLLSVSENKSTKKETALTALTEASANSFNQGVIRCDDKFYCPGGSSCCKGPKDKWNCCPYPLGVCCADGKHCCEYGYQCNPSSSQCTT
ncbi:granulins-like [Xiphophorus couchianus]|uniref:granulins-like n=1 Tax=Xiphophorus couchianus TaxID=32473 RepID=UPI001016C664|nr:granulins-like [Xiphophorus couchianus]XP_027892221.1 granulins-like [Xiphophorus couchianus]